MKSHGLSHTFLYFKLSKVFSSNWKKSHERNKKKIVAKHMNWVEKNDPFITRLCIDYQYINFIPVKILLMHIQFQALSSHSDYLKKVPSHNTFESFWIYLQYCNTYKSRQFEVCCHFAYSRLLLIFQILREMHDIRPHRSLGILYNILMPSQHSVDKIINWNFIDKHIQRAGVYFPSSYINLSVLN